MYHAMRALALLVAFCAISLFATAPDDCETGDDCLDIESLAEVSLLQGKFHLHGEKQAADTRTIDVAPAGVSVTAIVEPSAKVGEQGLSFFQMDEEQVHTDKSVEVPVEEEVYSRHSSVRQTGASILAQATDHFHAVTDGCAKQVHIVMLVVFLSLCAVAYMIKGGSKIDDRAPRNDFLVASNRSLEVSSKVASKKLSGHAVDVTFARWNAKVLAMPGVDGFGLTTQRDVSGDKGGTVDQRAGDEAPEVPCSRQTGGVVELVGVGVVKLGEEDVSNDAHRLVGAGGETGGTGR